MLIKNRDFLILTLLVKLLMKILSATIFEFLPAATGTNIISIGYYERVDYLSLPVFYPIHHVGRRSSVFEFFCHIFHVRLGMFEVKHQAFTQVIQSFFAFVFPMILCLGHSPWQRCLTSHIRHWRGSEFLLATPKSNCRWSALSLLVVCRLCSHEILRKTKWSHE